eukprot:709769-Prorocentrum_minimum.AAC.1
MLSATTRKAFFQEERDKMPRRVEFSRGAAARGHAQGVPGGAGQDVGPSGQPAHQLLRHGHQVAAVRQVGLHTHTK